MNTQKIELPGNGLSKSEAAELFAEFGPNGFQLEHEHNLLYILWGVIREPMFLLLIFASVC